ncbi:hypothetical protein BDV38DRAFT_277578 [Aspergillus pseudotamarii]|uniref:Uncharacterized protein n=1 Tax=Aspergillus pseudotamarii TaxID=132259 RepID=A0A5N6T911_ASPPS|nr:uncharacterized protein BDV38DRAFT_277578 [Aspergillus pseudotamarii]KAE8142757.1 hypothetical protein BDV38DRAFT_277578 [Aspergillus pseudotamarii]
MTTPTTVSHQALAREILFKLLKTRYDPGSLRITALLGYGLSPISISTTEYLQSFHSSSGALTTPNSDETGDLREAILCGFPDAEDLPTSKPMRQGPAEFGSGRDIQWGLAKAWDDELAKDLAPWHLFDPAALEIRTPEQLEEARKEVEMTLGKHLDSWRF